MLWSATWLLAALLGGSTVPPEADGPPKGPVADRPHAPHLLEQGAGLELNRALRPARRRDCDAQAIVANIAKLGPGALQASLRLLDECMLPAIDGAGAQVTGEFQEKLLLDAMGHWEASLVWPGVEIYLAVPKGTRASPSARRAAVLAAGTCAVPEDLKRITEIALLPTETEFDPRIESALQVALEGLYRRRPEGLVPLAHSWRQFRPALLAPILRAAGAPGDSRALDLLAQALDQPGDLQAIALGELARQRAPEEFPMGLCETLRSLLDPDRPMPCQAACNALGPLGDFGSVDALVDLLSSPSEGISTTAYRALCNMSGLALPKQSASWRVWRVRESEWFEAREAALASDILDGSESQARAALLEMSVYRWERHRLSDIAAEGLKRPEESIRTFACTVLGGLGSPRACAALQEALREALQTEDEAWLLAVRAALAKCTAL